MTDFAKTPKSAIFWNSSKGGPRENRSKSRPNSQAPKTPCRKSHPRLICMRLKCNHRTTLCLKPRLKKCQQFRAMTNYAKTPKSAILEILQNGDQGKIAQKVGRTYRLQKHPAANKSSINWYALKVQSSDNIVPQTAALKVPAIPSNDQFPKDTKIFHFLKLFKGGTKGKSLKK